MTIDDNTIVSIINPADLCRRKLLEDIYDVDDIAERTRLLALFRIKAEELNVWKQLKPVIDAMNALDKQLADAFTRQNAKQNSAVPLDFDARGQPLNTVENFVKILEGDPYFDGMQFNLLTYSPEQVRNGTAERWTDADDAECRRYIEQKYHIHSLQKCDDAIRVVLHKNEYHPVRDLVNSLQWDGESRITAFLTRWTKCEDTPYTREVSRLIFAGGIHRLYNPGCKFDDMPVLIGTKQGEGKSTLVRWLALDDKYFAEVNEFDGQRGIEAVEGAWICEVSELLAMTRAREQEAIKSYLTRLNDRHRMPYDKRVTDHLRQCIFIGTTNKEQFLTDRSGNRRFYPIKVQQSGYDLFNAENEVREYIRQCWAEARELFMRGEIKPFADRNLIKEIRVQQQSATEDDYRVGMISSYLEDKEITCVLDVWYNALRMSEFTKPTKKDSNEISMILQSIPGWRKQQKVQRLKNYGVQMCWKRENPLADVNDFTDLPDF